MPCWYRTCAFLALAACAGATAGAAPDDPAGIPETPRAQAVAARLGAISKGFFDSHDLAIRALYSMPGMEALPDGTWGTHEVVDVARLVEQARGSTDPVVLDLLLWRCSIGRQTCDRVALATRWTRVDPENQVAWLLLASALKQRGDLAGARATFVRASRASAWHGHHDDMLHRTVKALPADLTGPERGAALSMLLGKASVVLPVEATWTLGQFCQDPDASREACARIVETMVRDSDDLMALTVSVPYAARAGVPADTLAAYRRKSDAIHWAMQQSMAFQPAMPDESEADDTPALRTAMRQREQRIETGERRLAERYLVERHVTEAEAAARYAATLSDAQRMSRDASLAGR